MKNTKLTKNDTRIMELTISRNGNDIIYLQTCKALEDFFQKQTQELATSGGWHKENGDPLEFHKLTGDYEAPFEQFMNDEDCVDNFGSGHLIEVGDYGATINVALLRAKDASEGITMKLNRKHTRSALQECVKTYKQVAKDIYQEFIRPTRVQTQLTITDM